MFLSLLRWQSVFIILYFHGSAFLVISSITRKMEINVSTITNAKYCVHQTQKSLGPFQLSACNWKARENVTALVISSMLGQQSEVSPAKSRLADCCGFAGWGLGMRPGGGDGHPVRWRMPDFVQLSLASRPWVARGGCPFPWLQCSTAGPPKALILLEGEGSLRGRGGGRSRNSKLHAQEVWKAQLLFKAFLICAAATSVWSPMDCLASHQRCFSGDHVNEDFFFFYKLKKKKEIPSAVMQRAWASAFPMLRNFILCIHAFWI